MRQKKPVRRGVSLGTLIMLACTIAVLAGFASLLPSFTGNQDILIDAARLAVAIDDSISQITESTTQLLHAKNETQQTIIPPFTSHTVSSTTSTQVPSSAATPTPLPTPTLQPKYAFTLCAGGAVELNTSVLKALTLNKTARYDLLTDQVQNALKADLSIITLQNTISVSNDLSNLNMPADILPAIRAMGVTAVNLGHSNALNYGTAGINETSAAIQNAGMKAFGAGQPTLISLNGVKVALLHYQNKLSSTGRKQMEEYERNSILSPIDLTLISSDIAAVRQAGAQVVAVTLWWGEDGKDEPTDEQLVQAQAIADAGADIILGAGNGALQPVQVLSANRGDNHYHPTLCAYSLGNLFSPDRESRVTLASILLKTKVVYDSATQSVAFENIAYTPMYAWRGKDQGATLQRILVNDPDHLPDFVDQNQQGVMERCMTLINGIMADTAIPIAE